MIKYFGILIFALLLSISAHAVEYFEMEVYRPQLTETQELEMESSNSWSSGLDESRFDGRIFRSSLEATYGYSDRWEFAAYADFDEAQKIYEYAGVRAHARTRFSKNWGAYIELELPRNFRQKDFGVELRPIFERNFKCFNFTVNPMVEFGHVASVSGPQIVDADEGAVSPSALGKKHWTAEWGMAMSLGYRYNSHLRPHLDWHRDFTENGSLLLPAVDFDFTSEFEMTVGAGFGLNSATEQKVALLRLEWDL